MRIETQYNSERHAHAHGHPDREIGVRIETYPAQYKQALIFRHPDREIGVRIETRWVAGSSAPSAVTPIVRSGCGLKLG